MSEKVRQWDGRSQQFHDTQRERCCVL